MSNNMKKKSIQIDERLFGVFEMMYKQEGDVWNDVVAKMCGCKDYTDFLLTQHICNTSTKTYIRCDKTIDWVDEVNKDD